MVPYAEANVLQALMAPEYWEALEQIEALDLNRIGYCENTFASFKKWFLKSFSVFATRSLGLSDEIE